MGNLKLQATMYITMGLIFLILYMVMGLFATALGYSGIGVFLLLAVAMLTIQYFVSPMLLDRMNGIQFLEKGHQIERMVNEEVKKAGLPDVKVGIDKNAYANAYTYGTKQSNARIVLTKGIIQRLNTDELKGVINHEIGHIKNRDMTLITIATLLPMVASYLVFALVMRNNRGIGGWLMANMISTATFFVFNIPVMYLSRLREYTADQFSKERMGSPEPLVGALQKIHATLGNAKIDKNMSTLMIDSHSLIELFSTHPKMEKRIANLRK